MVPRRRWSFLLWVLAAGLVLARCAGPAGPSPVGVAAPAPSRPAPKFSSPAEAEAALAAVEDRRFFDAETLSSAAAAGAPETRARAALALGRIADDRGKPLLRGLLKDAAPDVRAAAAFACEPMGDPILTPDLIALLSDPEPRVVASAAKAIGFLGRGDGQDALVAAIPAASTPEPRASMLAALWKTSNSSTQAIALRYAGDVDARVRRAAVYTLARKPLEGSLPALTAALTDSDADTAAIAARGLGLLEKKESLAPLAAALDSGKMPLVINALVALEAILEKNPGASVSGEGKNRVLALASDANGNVAAPALVLLRQFAGKDRQVFHRLWSIATTGEGRRRQMALLSVVALLRAKAETAIQAAANSSDAALRATAAEAMGLLPVGDARPYRDRFAADRDPIVRLAVLGSLKTPEAVQQNLEIVHSAFTDPDAGVRASAVEALGTLADPATLPLLQEAAAKSQSDSSPDVAIAVIGVCEKLRSEAGARAIVEALYRQGRTLVARLARRVLVEVLRADPFAFPAPEYKTGKTVSDYESLLAEAKKPWQASVETSRGVFTIRLAGAAAPLTVMNFVRLAQKKFFDGVSIHRVVPNFVLQDGDPTGTGNGGPGYEIRDEVNPLDYGRGAVGMALSGPDTGGSQWFVTHSPQPHLDALYTVFGEVASGQDVVERVEQGDRITRVTVSSGP
jgi:cyclophilin family peptidyl-prolyl cis-trans isomerase/HEAT repeat protein